jgi:hypothetical protein
MVNLRLEGQTTLPRHIMNLMLIGEQKTVTILIPYDDMEHVESGCTFRVQNREQEMNGNGFMTGTIDLKISLRVAHEIKIEFAGKDLAKENVPVRYKISRIKERVPPEDDPTDERNMGKDW